MRNEFRNIALRDAIARWAKVALADYRNTGPTLPLEGQRWVPIGDRQFRRQTERTYWYGTQPGQEARLRATPEFREAHTALRRDAVIGPQLDKLIGSLMSARRFEAEQVLDTLAQPTASGLEWDDAEFDARYAAFEHAMYADTLPHQLLAPIIGVTGEIESVDLGRGVSMSRMSDDEIDLAFRHGVLRPHWPHMPIAVAPEYAIKVEYEVKKVVTTGNREREPDWTAIDHANSVAARQHEDVERVVNALRLLETAPLQLAGTIRWSRAWVVAGGYAVSVAPQSGFVSAMYVLDAARVSDLRVLWSQMQDVRVDKVLGPAIRRFGYAAERPRPEDRLIDLMIAAEAACLRTGDESERGEVTYRLSLHVAAMVGGTDRRALFAFIKRAYRVRSIVVHGGTPSARDLRRRDGSRGDIHSVTMDLFEVLRLLLRDLIARVAENGPLDWERLVLNGG